MFLTQTLPIATVHIYFLTTHLSTVAMKSFNSTWLYALPALAGVHASPSIQDRTVAVDNTTLVPLLSKGDSCGYGAHPKRGSICGFGLCCNKKIVRYPCPE